MLKISLPKDNIQERLYILEVIFKEFMDVDYVVKFDATFVNWSIELTNRSILLVEDHFFYQYPNSLSYLKYKNIPDNVFFQKKDMNEYLVEKDIPIIYGNNKPVTYDKDNLTLLCPIDIFASSFFMLTRWEEYVNHQRDEHSRFPATQSLALKFGFLNRPVVNEYVEMLKNMLVSLDSNLEFKNRRFEFLVTHDVDNPKRYTTLKSGLREISFDVFKRKQVGVALGNLWRKVLSHIGLKRDIFDTFDYLMDISEKNKIKSYFFFKSQGTSKFDSNYQSNSPFIKELISKIKKRNHYIGFHPSYNAYNDSKRFKKEKEELELNFGLPLTFGRGHYLRFEVPTTWQIWEDYDMEWDSTLSYADKEGFRCGVCYPYPVFNILTQKKLKLKEIPLIVMDGSFVGYQDELTPEKMEQAILTLIKTVKKYDGTFVFLWHNDSFGVHPWKEYQHIYERILSVATNLVVRDV